MRRTRPEVLSVRTTATERELIQAVAEHEEYPSVNAFLHSVVLGYVRQRTASLVSPGPRALGST